MTYFIEAPLEPYCENPLFCPNCNEMRNTMITHRDEIYCYDCDTFSPSNHIDSDWFDLDDYLGVA